MKAGSTLQPGQAAAEKGRPSFAQEFGSLQESGSVVPARVAAAERIESRPEGHNASKLTKTEDIAKAAAEVTPSSALADAAATASRKTPVAALAFRSVTAAKFGTPEAKASSAVQGSGSAAAKSGTSKKLPESGAVPVTSAAAALQDAAPLVSSMAKLPDAQAAAFEGPAPTIEWAAPARGSKLTPAMGGAGRVIAGRGREAKASVEAQSQPFATANHKGAEQGLSGMILAAAPVGVSSMASAVAGGAGSAPGGLLAVPEVAAAGANGSAKVSEGAHTATPTIRHEVHDEMEGAAGAGLSEPRTLVSTPHVLEVGITGGAHGWLRVRAELEHTGEVTASLVASSAASADALHKELGAMSAYLKSEVVGVSSLAVTAMEKGGASQSLSQEHRGGSGSGGESGAGGRSSRQPKDEGANSSAWANFGSQYGGGAIPAALLGAGVGGWLNVRV